LLYVIASIVVAIWFFRSARAIGKSGLVWSIIGIGIVLLAGLVWIAIAITFIPSSLIFFPSTAIAGFLLKFFGVALSFALAFLVHRKTLVSQTPNNVLKPTP
jgi:uncharacterized membrane protein YjjP (DUF1212 family)